jgi:hypothetical protein
MTNTALHVTHVLQQTRAPSASKEWLCVGVGVCLRVRARPGHTASRTADGEGVHRLSSAHCGAPPTPSASGVMSL